jgi:hypothetical protein
MGQQTAIRPVALGQHPRRRRWAIAVGIVLVAVAATFVAAVLSIVGMRRSVPEFPSLRATPDSALRGTVAYVDRSSCVRLASASGQFVKLLYCLPQDELLMPGQDSKLIGPQLVWLTGDKLAITMFRMHMPKDGKSPTYSQGWQRVVDTRTGAVTRTPAAAVPATPDLGPRPTRNPSGQTISRSSSSDGRVKITLTDQDGTRRTLLSAHGPGEYTYGIRAAFWAPNWQWIAVDDGRILVLTPGSPPVTGCSSTTSARVAMNRASPSPQAAC